MSADPRVLVMDEIDFDQTEFFTSRSMVNDPHPSFDRLRECCPVQKEPHHDVVMVTGYEEAMAVLSDPSTFSSCNALNGPSPGFPDGQ